MPYNDRSFYYILIYHYAVFRFNSTNAMRVNALLEFPLHRLRVVSVCFQRDACFPDVVAKVVVEEGPVHSQRVGSCIATPCGLVQVVAPGTEADFTKPIACKSEILETTDFRVKFHSVRCPHCREHQTGGIEDPRGRDHQCGQCGKMYRVPFGVTPKIV